MNSRFSKQERLLDLILYPNPNDMKIFSFMEIVVVSIARYANPFAVVSLLDHYLSFGYTRAIYLKQLVKLDSYGRIALDYLLTDVYFILELFPKEKVKLLELATKMLFKYGAKANIGQINQLSEHSFQTYIA